jgi:sulfite reductase alpha subunit-like flavoprotein
MIGPGTGMAPFRGFWQERKLLREQGALSGKMSLFVGCRDPKMVLYNSELKEMQSAKILTNVFKAYSRVPNMQKVS